MKDTPFVGHEKCC